MGKIMVGRVVVDRLRADNWLLERGLCTRRDLYTLVNLLAVDL